MELTLMQKGKSTMTQLLCQIDTVLDMIKDGDNCEIVFLDFAKAYVKIDFL